MIFFIYIISDVDFWSEIGPESDQVDFLVEPFDQDRVLHYLAFFGLDVEILIPDLQQEIDNEDTQDDAPAPASLREVIRPKRQNSLLDLLPFFSSQAQSRPRRKPQFSDFIHSEQPHQQSRRPRKFPSNSNNGKNVLLRPSTSSSHPPPSNAPVSNFTSPGMNIHIIL